MQNTGFIVTEGRKKKAQKIEAVIAHSLGVSPIQNKKILDIGCGTGEIIGYFATDNDVYGCDRNDQLDLKARESINFSLINATDLPYPDNFFDIVITNHVIEHLDDQSNHMMEIARVLKPQGLCYFSTPNRLFPVEPHYRIPLLHYLPTRFFIYVLKASRRYHEDLDLVSYFGMRKLFRKSGFSAREYTPYILKYPEKYHWDGVAMQRLPLLFIRVFSIFSQTNIFILRPNKVKP